MKRIWKLMLSVLLITGSVLYVHNPAFANSVSNMQSPWPTRTYTHEQWMRVFVKVGSQAEKLIDANWRPVFSYPETLSDGYTADEPNNVSGTLGDWLRAANFYDAHNNMYIFSNQGAQELSLGSPYLTAANWDRSVPYHKTSSDAEIASVFGKSFWHNPKASISNPIAVQTGPPSDLYWDGQYFHYALSSQEVDGEKRGIINLNPKSGADKAFVNPSTSSTGYGEIHLAFPYDVQFTSAPIIFDKTAATTAGKTVDGQIRVTNLSPFPSIGKYTKFRVYTWVNGESAPKLNNEQELSLNPNQEEPVGFNFNVPAKPYRLIVTVNMDYSGRWLNEPLCTVNAGSPVAEVEEEYTKNKTELPMDASLTENPNNTPSNLAVTNLELLDSNDKPVSGIVVTNKAYKIRATFSSTFEKSGWAGIRFYSKDSKGNYIQQGSTSNIQFQPYGTYTATSNWTGRTDSTTLAASINYQWRPEGWLEELFENEKEAIYSDNKKEITTAGGTDLPSGPPTPGSWSYPLYYPVAKETLIPQYKTVVTQKIVPGWQEVKYIVDNTKAKVRLVEPE